MAGDDCATSEGASQRFQRIALAIAFTVGTGAGYLLQLGRGTPKDHCPGNAESGNSSAPSTDVTLAPHGADDSSARSSPAYAVHVQFDAAVLPEYSTGVRTVLRYRSLSELHWTVARLRMLAEPITIRLDDAAARVVEWIQETPRSTLLARAVVCPSANETEIVLREGTQDSVLRCVDEASGDAVANALVYMQSSFARGMKGLEFDPVPPTAEHLSPAGATNGRGEVALRGHVGEFRVYFIRSPEHAWRRVVLDGLRGGVTSIELPLRAGGGLRIRVPKSLVAPSSLVLIDPGDPTRQFEVGAEGQDLPLDIYALPVGSWLVDWQSNLIGSLDVASPSTATLVTVARGETREVTIDPPR